MQEITVGIGGAAGDGLDKSGDTLAKTAGRLGLYVYAYNSYQSIIRGGHIWLKVRIGQDKVYSHGDHLTALIALNEDTLERHAHEVEEGGIIVFNSDRLHLDSFLSKKSVQWLSLPLKEITKEVSSTYGPIQPVMQNTVAVGAMLHALQLEFNEAEGVLTDTFQHKGQLVINHNIALLKAGYEYAKNHCQPITQPWSFTRQRKAFVTGNEAIALGAVAAGCKLYTAYPMTPASSILHWLASHSEKVGVVVKQCEDELSVINMAIGGGIAGVRTMCATSGGGFALMTEALGMAGMSEVPVVCVEVQRGGPSTGLPTKTEQADLNQVFGASQGEYPRMIVAPADVVDAYYTTVEAFNCADKYQLPVIIMSDLLLSEHPETIESNALKSDVKINRGEIVSEWSVESGRYKRFAFTQSGVSPRAFPGTPNTLYVSATDDHDEESILISDMYTSPAIRRKSHEKRMRKLDNLLKELRAPELAGPKDADVTLVSWGTTFGVLKEAVELLNQEGIKCNYLHVKYIYPFHAKEITEILTNAKKKVSVEVNFTSQFARYLRSETGIAMDAHINKYDGEPFEPRQIAQKVKDILAGKDISLAVSELEARDIAYHYLLTHSSVALRPGKLTYEAGNGCHENTWKVDIIEKQSGVKKGEIVIGAETGSTYKYRPVNV